MSSRAAAGAFADQAERRNGWDSDPRRSKREWPSWGSVGQSDSEIELGLRRPGSALGARASAIPEGLRDHVRPGVGGAPQEVVQIVDGCGLTIQHDAWHIRCSLSPAERKRAMRNTKILLFVIASIVAPLATSAEAQVHFSLGGGFTTPNSEVRDHLGNGYNFNFGLQVDVTPVIGIEGLYSFNGLGSKDLSINVFPQPIVDGGVPTDISADMNMQYGTVNLVVQRPNGGVRPYGLVGMGVYYRPIKVSTPGVGWVPGTVIPGGTSATRGDGSKPRISWVSGARPTLEWISAVA